jgi:hypothetical protein
VSELGDLVRLPPALSAEIASVPDAAYERMTNGFGAPERLELDWQWKPFGALMETAGFPVNPFRSGELFPNEETAFGADGDSRVLSVGQVATVARVLQRTPFDVLGAHLREYLEDEATAKTVMDYRSPDYRKPLPPEQWIRSEVEEDVVRDRYGQLDESYRDLTDFYRVAAANGEQTVFWWA